MILFSEDTEMQKGDIVNIRFGAKISSLKSKRLIFSDRNYYSIVLQLGKGKFSYKDKCVLVDQPAILYGSPILPYAWESTLQKDNHDELYYKIFFDESFLGDIGDALTDTPFYNNDKEPILFLNSEDVVYIKLIYEKINEGCQLQDERSHKFFSSYLYILFYELNRLKNTPTYFYKSAAQRIVELFLNMLDSQFSQINSSSSIELIKPIQYADKLCIHVNHLNRVVKKTTGKTTTEIISSRILATAKRLLKETSLSIGEIALNLGFEETASFSKFFRIHTGFCPKVYRTML